MMILRKISNIAISYENFFRDGNSLYSFEGSPNTEKQETSITFLSNICTPAKEWIILLRHIFYLIHFVPEEHPTTAYSNVKQLVKDDIPLHWDNTL